MELRWEDLPIEQVADTTKKLMEYAEIFAKNRDPKEFFNLLQVCDLLSLPWYEMQSMRDSVLQSFYATFPRDGDTETKISSEIFRYAFYFGKAGFRWNELPSEVQETILRESLRHSPSFTASQLSSLLQG
jgi:hypothetical protein